MKHILLSNYTARFALLAALFGPVSVKALQPQNEGGTPPSNCSAVPGATEVKLDWRGQNLVGCKVELVSTRSRIHRVASDCTTIFYTDLPAYVPRQWAILSEPPGAEAQITANASGATLTLPRAGDYTVQLTVCPAGNCQVFEFPGSPSPGSLIRSGSRSIRGTAPMITSSSKATWSGHGRPSPTRHSITTWPSAAATG